MKKYIISLLCLSGIVFYSCSSDSEDPMTSCETESLTYTNDIAAIINSTCATSTACHNSNSNSTFSLGSYPDILIEVPNNRISGAINHSSGFSPMPRNASKLDDCTIDKIDQWLNDGAPE